jgi:hypothetical protein
MTTSAAPRHSTRRLAESAGTLRWIFVRGTKALTCEVRVLGKTGEVSVVPHWDVSSSVIETLDHPTSALRRHAEIAAYLRQTGWSLLRGGVRQTAGAAA